MNDKKVKQYVFKFECAEVWENLTETQDDKIRHCGRCDRNVHLVRNGGEFADNAAKGRCIYFLPMQTAGIPFMPDESEK